MENEARIERLKSCITNKHPKPTQQVIADFCGVTRGAVNNWLNTGEIKPSNIVRLAEFFGVTEAWLLFGVGELESNVTTTYTAPPTTAELLAQLAQVIAAAPVRKRGAIVAALTGLVNQPHEDTTETLAYLSKLLTPDPAELPKGLVEYGAVDKALIETAAMRSGVLPAIGNQEPTKPSFL